MRAQLAKPRTPCREHGATTLCRPAAVQPPSSSSLQLYARVAAVVNCFDRSLRCFSRLYATTSRCRCYGSVKCHADVKCHSDHDRSNLILLHQLFLYLCPWCTSYDKAYHGTTLLLCYAVPGRQREQSSRTVRFSGAAVSSTYVPAVFSCQQLPVHHRIAYAP